MAFPPDLDDLPAEAGKATLVYELCCYVCGDFEHSLRPLREHAASVGFVKDGILGWVHVICLKPAITVVANVNLDELEPAP